jgi:hypothetical protein
MLRAGRRTLLGLRAGCGTLLGLRAGHWRLLGRRDRSSSGDLQRRVLGWVAPGFRRRRARGARYDVGLVLVECRRCVTGDLLGLLGVVVHGAVPPS